MAEVLPVYKSSFFTNREREDGVRLKVLFDAGTVFSELLFDDRFDNGAGFIYGGILFGVMDVLIWHAILMQEKKVAVTRKVDVDFLAPIRCYRPYTARARVEGMEDKDILVKGWIEDGNGTVCTQVKAVFRESRGITMADVVNQLDLNNCSPEMRRFFLDAARDCA